MTAIREERTGPGAEWECENTAMSLALEGMRLSALAPGDSWRWGCEGELGPAGAEFSSFQLQAWRGDLGPKVKPLFLSFGFRTPRLCQGLLGTEEGDMIRN